MTNNEDQPQEEEEISERQAAMIMAAMQEPEEEPNTLGLVGDINEDTAQEVFMGLLQLNGGKVFPNPVAEDEEQPVDVDFLISTGGGTVYDMFGMVDMMDIVKKRRDIRTLGIGKVFSAGGTPGKRFLTRNSRIMIHRCSAGNLGSTADIKVTADEARLMEDQMVQIMAKNSKLSVGEIHNMFSRNTDEYFSAEEAVQMGLADEII